MSCTVEEGSSWTSNAILEKGEPQVEDPKVGASATREIGKGHMEGVAHLKASPIGAAASPTSGSPLLLIERLHRDPGDQAALEPAGDRV